jgi:alginate O-acetyltransferase complex protein AlgI
MVARGKFRNILLLLFSLVFYAWAGVSFLLIILSSATLNYFAGYLIEKKLNRKGCRSILIFSVIINVLLLCIFKYLIFFTDNINALLILFGAHTFTLKNIILPLGISFFTFQNIAYLFDVYREKTRAERNFLIYVLSVIFFPKVIAGPIIRHQEISDQIRNRKIGIDDFVYGLRRFIIGLAKKVIVADMLAVVADQVFALSPANHSFLLCWIGIIAYTLQVYVDFSGYSDMAIGISRMLGFRINENFNFPYLSKSLTEFWRRWHITLSSWLRDYVFTPLSVRYRNKGKAGIASAMIITFLICGIWHGAGWTFIFWGVLHGIILAAESIWYGKKLAKAGSFFSHFYLIIIIMLTWIFFRSDTLFGALHYIKTLFTFSVSRAELVKAALFMNKEMIIITIIALLGVFGVFHRLGEIGKNIHAKVPAGVSAGFDLLFTFVEIAAIAVVLLISSAYLATLTYSPFIYFRF